jgi:16S rRNA (guanine527-N7)-methyltransferase
MGDRVLPNRHWLRVLAEQHEIPDITRLRRFVEVLKRAEEVPEKYRRERRAMVAETLGALHLLPLQRARLIADIGTGYGYPGLVLACVLEARVSLVEPQPPRVAFLERAIQEVGLRNVEVVPIAVARWDARDVDIVTCKNVARLSTVAEWAAPLLRVGGDAIFWLKRRGLDDAGLAAARTLGLDLADCRPAYHGSSWLLVTLRKVRDTPPGFPRKPRMALKRPLGADVLTVQPPESR